jgi:hypothetical protein
MKRSLLIALCALAFQQAKAQFPTSITGLQLRVDAATGFNANGASPATWTDQSGGATLTSGTGAAEPVYVASAAGTGFPGIQFDSSDYIGRPGDSRFNNPYATLFVVRIANTISNTIPMPSLTNVQTTLSIGESGTYNFEFGLISDWGIHCSSSGAWTYKTHQCYSQLKDSLPAITAVRLNTGTTNSDIDYYVNGVLSTEIAKTPAAAPTSYIAVNRSVVLGARYLPGYNAQEFFKGFILEAIAYNRLLTNAEMDSVDKYLKCKYNIKYAACNKYVYCYKESVNGVSGEEYSNKLYGNTPNPFSTETTISYRVVSMKQSASIDIYDVTGRKLKQAAITSNGEGTITINTENFSAGMYLYTLTVDGQTVDTRKMVLAK